MDIQEPSLRKKNIANKKKNENKQIYTQKTIRAKERLQENKRKTK